ncbi:MAG: hypothetical protein Q4D45_04410 [Lachnospiraceae bacterium]|nr:hypothetical protein [Lachnospiraceae bacterium]
MNTKRVLSPKDLLFRIALQWRKIIVCMLVFAILANGYSVLKSYRTVLSSQSNNSKSIDLDSYKGSLSTDQISVVEKAFSTYKQYNHSFKSAEDYCQNAVKMKIEHEKVPTVTILYKIKNCDNISGLISVIANEVFSEKWIKNVQKELGWEKINSEYIYELIKISQADEQNNSNNSSTITLTESNDDEKVNILCIQIISTDKKTAEKIAYLATNELKNQQPEFQKKYQFFSMSKISQKFAIKVDSDLLSNQQWHIEKMNNFYNVLNNLTNNFDDNQKNYYRALIDSESITDTVQINEESNNSEEIKSKIDFISKKYILLGLIVGAFLACCYYAFLYIMDSGLHTMSEITDCFGISLLGELDTKNDQKSKIDNYIYRLFEGNKPIFSHNERMNMICAGIKIAVDQGKMSSLHITGTANTEDVNSVKNKLLELLKDMNVKITVGKSVAYDPISLEQLSSADGTVFVEQLNKSPYDDIEQEMEVCKKYDVKVIGSIILK